MIIDSLGTLPSLPCRPLCRGVLAAGAATSHFTAPRNTVITLRDHTGNGGINSAGGGVETGVACQHVSNNIGEGKLMGILFQGYLQGISEAP